MNDVEWMFGACRMGEWHRQHMAGLTCTERYDTSLPAAPLLALCTVCSNSWGGARNKVDYDHGNMRTNIDYRALCVYA